MLKVYDSRILSLILTPEPCKPDIFSDSISVKARSAGQGSMET